MAKFGFGALYYEDTGELMISFIIKGWDVGRAFGHVDTEFQKSGLPHAHILIWQNKEKPC